MEPEKRPNGSSAIKVLGGRMYLDSPTQSHGVSIKADQRDGHLNIVVEADESVLGCTVNVNGREL